MLIRLKLTYYSKKINFAKKSNFKTRGLWLLEYHSTILSTELFFITLNAQRMAGVLRPIDQLLYFARSHASSPAVIWQKVNCTSESPSPSVCTFNSRASCGFFVTTVMSLLSEHSAHCEVAEVLTMPRPGKLNHGLSQCERTCGHGNSVSVSQCGHGGGT